VASVTYEHVTKKFSTDSTAVDDLSLEIRDTEFMVLVGPSGCGKSTALRMLAGLEDITAGQIKIDDQVVNEMPPRDRDVAMVFQSYALYPHMSVFDNMGFGLKMRGSARSASRVSSRAANGSASRSDAPSSVSLGSSCSTSRFPTWTPCFEYRLGSSCRRCTSGWALPLYMSPTTRSRR